MKTGSPARPGPTIAVDLTPVLPDGINGGSRTSRLTLIQHLLELTPSWSWIFLTAPWNHADLADLEGPTVERLLVQNPQAGFPWLRSAGIQSDGSLPSPVRIDLLFCPFLMPTFYDPSTPTVSVISDILHRDSPEVFSRSELCEREYMLRAAGRLSDAVVCISEFTTAAVRQAGIAHADRLHTILNMGIHREESCSSPSSDNTLNGFGLEHGRFLLYPANLWPHKNHRRLLLAFAMFRDLHPDSQLKLVCTGATLGRDTALTAAAREHGLSEHVIFRGYVSREVLVQLMIECSALISASLYEGFGIPAIEGLGLGKPLILSDIPAFHELAADAALYFDPLSPLSILQAIARIELEAGVADTLALHGKRRAEELPREDELAAQYIRLFEQLLSAPRAFRDALHGIEPNSGGHVRHRLTVTFTAAAVERVLELDLDSPSESHSPGRVQINMNGDEVATPELPASAESYSARLMLPRAGGYLQVFARQRNDQPFRCLGCRIVSKDAQIDLIREMGLSEI